MKESGKALLIYSFFTLVGSWNNGYLVFCISFDTINILDKFDRSAGLWFSVGDSSHNDTDLWFFLHDYEDCSYFGVRFLEYMPDTVYFTVWGYTNLYVDRPMFRSLSKEEREKVFRKESDGTKKKGVLGEMIFVKTDSLIIPKKRMNYRRVLLQKDDL